MNKPLISYVVTAYNIENYIAESIECAFAQTYSPLQIVLSDDCSTDRTFEIMQSMTQNYTGPHLITLNRNERNLGITEHMNKAYMELAQGEIIIAAHGDDLSKPERTELSYKYLKEYPNVTALSFSIQAVDENGNNLTSHSAIVDRVHFYDFKGGANIPAPSRAFYKNVMSVFGPLNKECPTEDELISFRALLLGENAFFPEVMVKYRKHSGSSSNPENFEKFPLDKILEQQNDDMKKAIQMGLITETEKENKYRQLEQMTQIRKKYRVYFSSRKIQDLFKLVIYDKVPFKLKLHYIKEHLEYLKSI